MCRASFTHARPLYRGMRQRLSAVPIAARSRSSSGSQPSESCATLADGPASSAGSQHGTAKAVLVRRPVRAPWLAFVTGCYLVWSLLPLLLVIVYSFNAGDTVTHWQGFSLRWWVGDPSAAESIVYDPETRTRLAHSLVLASLTTGASPCRSGRCSHWDAAGGTPG